MNKAVLLLLSTSVVLGVATLHLVSELRAERAQGESLQARIADLERTAGVQDSFGAPPSPAGVAAVAVRSPFDRTAPAQAVAASTSNPAAPPVFDPHMMRESIERERALLRDPEYREALLLQHKSMLAQMHPGLARELGLTAEQTDRLFALLAEQQVKLQDMPLLAFDRAPDPAMVEEHNRRLAEHERASQDEIRALLGEDKWSAWQRYQSTASVREQGEQLRREFAARGAPLRDDQVKPLQQALLESHERSMQSWSGFRAEARAPEPGTETQFREEVLRRHAEENERLRTALMSVLTPEQLRYFEEKQNAQMKLQDAQMRMMRARLKAQPPGDVEPGSAGFVVFGSGSGRIRAQTSGAASLDENPD